MDILVGCISALNIFAVGFISDIFPLHSQLIKIDLDIQYFEYIIGKWMTTFKVGNHLKGMTTFLKYHYSLIFGVYFGNIG